MQMLGKMLVLFGGGMVAIGLLLMFSGRIPFLGKLPGDFSFKKDNIQVFFPVTSSIIVSILVSLVLWAISHWRGK
jgi:hypothetical protein